MNSLCPNAALHISKSWTGVEFAYIEVRMFAELRAPLLIILGILSGIPAYAREDLCRWDLKEIELRQNERTHPRRVTERLRRAELRAVKRYQRAEGKDRDPEIGRMGSRINGLGLNEILEIHASILTSRTNRQIRSRRRKRHVGYYQRLSFYPVRDHDYAAKNIDDVLQSIGDRHQMVNSEPLYLDSSFVIDRKWVYLEDLFPDLESERMNFVILPGVAAELNQGNDYTKSSRFKLSRKFSRPLSSAELAGMDGILREFQYARIGARRTENLDSAKMDGHILAEAMIAASAARSKRGKLLLKDFDFFESIWKAAQRFDVDLENGNYSFRLIAELQVVGGIEMPVVRILTSKPVHSELVVIHPFVRVDPSKPGRTYRISESSH